MTHSELIERAEIWLKKVKRCAIVLTERGCSVERADAIGWTYGGVSYLVECKASRPDFLADKRKPHRVDGTGFGAHRYYMAPAGLIQKSEVDPMWGLLEVHPRQIRVYEPLLPSDDPTLARVERELRVLVATFAGQQPPATDDECALIGE